MSSKLKAIKLKRLNKRIVINCEKAIKVCKTLRRITDLIERQTKIYFKDRERYFENCKAEIAAQSAKTEIYRKNM